MRPAILISRCPGTTSDVIPGVHINSRYSLTFPSLSPGNFKSLSKSLQPILIVYNLRSSSLTSITMPIFGSRREPSPPPAAPQKTSMFSRRRSSSPHRTSTHHSHTTTTTSPKLTSGMFSRSSHDPSITAATQSLRQAEAAERDADRALLVAKNAVREAREHVHRLEREAAEEARLAKIKQSEAKALGKKGRALGRHDHI
ncbi:hypothetical protein HBI56_120680 [Parastagonospora nodorum]|uniref:Uncharacterized protein n=2 Tax=Phaeosphaeria nodorum (strain SN15 / ATCC MYA-4574 / FGSC 10173) TaxID=321614 RepID=A0A7U2FBL1_PHANO|nr:hypothetical protein HBH56_054040 [Parastagonospora nodorum]QRD02295.1 hypothetical protein JI435_052710 [Parastagonospora nodorum SN15]KAH3935854.1 hypothetical protein HBH54_039840 [Parastagonospora nodorum]KAH3948592.1 hypothetical protein HBH53_099430 [Parastagonospora nodorum]KAH3970135.1 hypothetical protein HBH51_119980 [Parastagonospora nodorum]